MLPGEGVVDVRQRVPLRARVPGRQHLRVGRTGEAEAVAGLEVQHLVVLVVTVAAVRKVVRASESGVVARRLLADGLPDSVLGPALVCEAPRQQLVVK